MRSLVVALLCLAAGAAQAGGFATRDLTAVAADVTKVLDRRFVSRAEPDRLTLTCPECRGAPIIDILIGRQADGTEDRVRSGQTSIAQLEAICRSRSPDCRLSGLSVAPGVGWISTYAIGTTAGSTAVILRDGDLLTIRSLAGEREVATRHAKTLATSIAPSIVGR